MSGTLPAESSIAKIPVGCSTAALLTTDVAGYVTSCSSTFQDLGIGTSKSPISKHWETLFDSPLESQVEGESGVQWFFFPFPDDPKRGFRVSRYPMVDEDGSEDGFYLVVERRESTDANDRMLYYEKMFSLGEASSHVAHEINNPLSVISGWLQILQLEKPKGSEELETLGLMQQEVARIARIVKNLLSFARRQPSEFRFVDINAMISELIEFIGNQFRNENITVIAAPSIDLPFVWVDPNQLRQVLWNLANNARQAMKDGGQLFFSTHTGDDVEIRVRDTGPGIPEETMARIFEPFFTTKQGSGGTGLGLSVSRGIIDSMGGRLEAESTPAVGTTFTISLPIAKAEQNANG